MASTERGERGRTVTRAPGEGEPTQAEPVYDVETYAREGRPPSLVVYRLYWSDTTVSLRRGASGYSVEARPSGGAAAIEPDLASARRRAEALLAARWARERARRLAGPDSPEEWFGLPGPEAQRLRALLEIINQFAPATGGVGAHAEALWRVLEGGLAPEFGRRLEVLGIRLGETPRR